MTSYLLDTHALLWAISSPAPLSRRALRVIADDDHELLVSTASAWEISTKFRLGKLPGGEPLLEQRDVTLTVLRARSVPIGHQVALRGGS